MPRTEAQPDDGDVQLRERPIQFERDDSGSFERPDHEAFAAERINLFRWRVQYQSSDRVHTVRLAEEGDHFLGACDCKGFKFVAGPCSHLWAVKRFDLFDIPKLKDALDGFQRCPVCDGFGKPEGRR